MTSDAQGKEAKTGLRTHADIEKERKEAIAEIFQLNQVIEDANRRIEYIWEYLRELDQKDARISESRKKQSYSPDLV